MQTAERSSVHDPSESVIYNRCLFPYSAASGIVKGSIIELGSGEGYGISILAPVADKYLAVDKFDTDTGSHPNVEFRKILLPSLEGVQDNSFDFAVTFQVIEHIKNDRMFISEIHRVLRPGGKLLLTTPNRLMSLSRNPWHIREYTGEELKQLIGEVFGAVELKGVYGSVKVDDYHNKNRESVNRLMRFDILNLQYRLPRWVLKIPYDIMNRLNRKKLLNTEQSLVQEVTTADFTLRNYDSKAYDIFIIATK